jgi:3D (Asp-Asp-Asp) domain-containing protein
MRLSKIFGFLMLLFIIGIAISNSAQARHHRHRRSNANNAFCGGKTASLTVYNSPHFDDPATYASYFRGREDRRSPNDAAFRRAVHTEGSGIQHNGSTLHYTGQVEGERCKRFFGDPTVIGAYGSCLVPFQSIACDTKYYPLGTIIHIPSYEEATVRTPPWQINTQLNGYFKCADVGSAIKGPGRFDIYTGAFGDADKRNDLIGGPLSVGKLRCDREFEVFTKGTPGSPEREKWTELTKTFIQPFQWAALSSTIYKASNAVQSTASTR